MIAVAERLPTPGAYPAPACRLPRACLRTAKQTNPSMRAPAPQRAAPGAGQVVCGLPRERLGRRVCGSELDPVTKRLLEVVADELVVAFAPSDQPVGEPLVQVAAARFRRTAVGDVADEDVVEAQPLLAQAAPVGWISPRCTSERRCSSARPRFGGRSSRTAVGQNSRPMTAARSMNARSPGPKRSGRARAGLG